MAEATQSQIRAEQLIAELLNDPENGSRIRARAKEKFPDVTFPEDHIQPVIKEFETKNAALEAQIAELAAWKKSQEDASAEKSAFKSLESKVNEAVTKFNLTDEGKAKMLDRMKETGNLSDPEAAAALIAHRTPVEVKGPTWAPQNINLFGSAERDESLAALHRNPEKYMDDQLVEFVKNPDKYVSETFGS